jgi:putative intracellular protease/amidase
MMEKKKLIGTYLFDGFDIQGVEMLIRELMVIDKAWYPVYFSDIESNLSSSTNLRVIPDYSAFSVPDLDLMILPDIKGNTRFLSDSFLLRRLKKHIEKGKKVIAIAGGIKMISTIIDDRNIAASGILAMELEFINSNLHIEKGSPIVIDGNICTLLDEGKLCDNLVKIIDWI